MNSNENTNQLANENTGKISFAVGIAGILLCVVGYLKDPEQFIHSYLVAYMFWVTICLGALFFTLMHHLTGAVWSTVLRHILDAIMSTIPLMAILWIPIGFGIHDLYHWSHASAVAHDALLQAKAPYLNTTFFVVRTLIYFIIWSFLSIKLIKLSRSAVTHADLDRMRKVSAIGTVLFALTFSFAMFDWLMSLDPHWYSTIYGVYLFGGAYLNAFVIIVLIVFLLKKSNILDGIVTEEHYQDLGKFMFGFIVFWAYISASQYFLIWYGNIPEETIWYKHRWVGSWKTVSLTLVFVGFVLPFIILMFRSVKRNLTFLTAISLLIFAVHYLDMFWNVMPGVQHHGAHFSWMDISTFLAISGIVFGFIWRSLVNHPIYPSKDPFIQKSIAFKNF